MSSSGWVHLEDCKILGETDKAFKIDHKGTRYWIPKSVIADVEDYSIGDMDVTVSVEEWFAVKEDLC
jgi:hypothetical protein